MGSGSKHYKELALFRVIKWICVYMFISDHMVPVASGGDAIAEMPMYFTNNQRSGIAKHIPITNV